MHGMDEEGQKDGVDHQNRHRKTETGQKPTRQRAIKQRPTKEKRCPIERQGRVKGRARMKQLILLQGWAN